MRGALAVRAGVVSGAERLYRRESAASPAQITSSKDVAQAGRALTNTRLTSQAARTLLVAAFLAVAAFANAEVRQPSDREPRPSPIMMADHPRGLS